MAINPTAARLRARPVQNEEPMTWEIDTSTGTPILVYEKCSVIQDEQAYQVLDALTRAAEAGIGPGKKARLKWLIVGHIKKGEQDRLRPWLYHAPGCATNCHEPSCTTPHECNCGLDAALNC